MRFARLGEAGSEIPVVVGVDGVYDLRPVTSEIDGTFLAEGLQVAERAFNRGELPQIESAHLRVGAPIARPMAVVCVGMNYAAHAAESGAAPPSVPIIFYKHPATVIGPNDPVEIPRRSKRTDWEVELGVVIGQRALYLDSRESAMNHIAGYTVVNDVSERTFQLEESGGQWSKGKSSPGFNPTGPYLVTPDEVDVNNLRLRSWVNSELRQDSNTSDMIFDVPAIIHHLSQYMALEPGDLVLTGTPEGVALSGLYAYLEPGDVVETEISSLGRQRQEFTPAT